MEKPHVEECYFPGDFLIIWIAVPIIFGVAIILTILFCNFVIRRRRKATAMNWQEFKKGSENDFNEDYDEEIEIPRPKLRYYV